MKLRVFYIDTEYNERGGELISLALVNVAATFYECLECKIPTPWVKRHVIPHLGNVPIALNSMQRKLEAFLAPYDEAIIVADWPEDIQYFCQLVVIGPGQRIHIPKLTLILDPTLEANDSYVPHNALEDADANRRFDLARNKRYADSP